ncbi:Factor VIII intron 22 protein-like [Homarus americanus]|uniref:Factor VIII intron 22 protein-like n=1 Tax=Homarus americanus TaxID=6706 RepID=A0A8J5MPX7_HOMAM|nr:Factor VIII intron 22 protein-like [Homarus americanus]
MESVVVGNDFLLQYRNISSKLKKRFLRKPNVAEASEEFGQLARELSDGEAWAQAGLCCVAVARCEQTLVNPTTEVSAITQAARYFLKAEVINNHLHCPSFNEHLMTAISCYQHAIQLYLDQKQPKPALAASLAALQSLGRPSEALIHLRIAADLHSASPFHHLTCLGYIASCKIELGDLHGALMVFTQMTTLIEQTAEQPLTGAYKDILARCEISSLLILLTLRPLPQHTKQPHAKLLEKYSWTTPDLQSLDVPYDDAELVVLLQSLVLTCQSRDTQALATLSQHLTRLLGPEHLHLLHTLVTEMNRT